MDKEYRSNEGDLKYFGSDLNKFVNEECTDKMTVNNIDLIQYKRSKNELRIIEYKHKNEKMPYSQRELLKIVAKVFKYLNKISRKMSFGVYVVSGNYPYEEAKIKDLINKKTELLNQKELIDFLEFKDPINH